MAKFTGTILFLLVGLLLLPAAVFGAHNTTTFDSDTNLYVYGLGDSGETVRIKSGSEVASFVVNSSNITFTMNDGSSVVLQSDAKRTMLSSTGEASTCQGNYSQLSITAVTDITPVITFANTYCGGSSSPAPSSSGGAVIITPDTTTTTTETTTTTTATTTTTTTTTVPETTKPISQMTTTELRAEVVRISTMILQLQQELLAMMNASGQLTKNLKYNDRGDEVTLLQTWLAKDAVVYPSGKITGWFGPATKAAVVKFQEKYKSEVLTPLGLSKGTGNVGSATRNKLNSLYSNK